MYNNPSLLNQLSLHSGPLPRHIAPSESVFHRFDLLQKVIRLLHLPQEIILLLEQVFQRSIKLFNNILL